MSFYWPLTGVFRVTSSSTILTVKENCKPQLARYNDPFTPGFLRTNEIWVVINKPQAATVAA